MKILCFIDSLGPGGAQRQLVELAKGFKEKEYEVSFLTYHEINFFKPELDRVGIPVQTIVEPNYFKRIFKIRKAIRNEKPDAVLSFLEGANFMATLAGFPFRKWNLVVGERSANPAILKSKKLRFYRWFHLLADHVVGNSQTNLNLVKKINPFLFKSKLKVIYNIPSIAPTPLNDEFQNREITEIVIAASYRRVKNLDGLIEAVKTLPYDDKKRLIINWYGEVYESEYYHQMKKRITETNLGEILYLNKATTNIHQKYLESGFVGLFSRYEGFPNTISEAMALGKPVICSKISDIPKFITENENGFLCDSESPESIQNAIIKAIDSSEKERERMGVNNMKIANERFNRDRIINNYLELLARE